MDGAPADAPVPAAPGITRLIERSMARFLASSGKEESAAILRELRAGIRAADDQAAAAAIVGFLKSGKDVPTHLPFVVGPDGVMALTPTLRTALLDLLPTLDPLVALEVARGVMAERKSPDEYALALRNLAWNDLDGDLRSELSDRFDQMLKTRDWSANPSAGFLEALDVGVEIVDKRSFDSIVRLNRDALVSANSPLARASFMALDRMVFRDSSLLVESFLADPGLAGLSSDQRASLMSRLDVTDPAQRDVLVRYVTAANHGPGELDYFAGIFPNGNCLHGSWLVTSGESAPSIDSRLQADREVLAEIDRLIAGEANEVANQTLVRIRERLRKVIKE